MTFLLCSAYPQNTSDSLSALSPPVQRLHSQRTAFAPVACCSAHDLISEHCTAYTSQTSTRHAEGRICTVIQQQPSPRQMQSASFTCTCTMCSTATNQMYVAANHLKQTESHGSPKYTGAVRHNSSSQLKQCRHQY